MADDTLFYGGRLSDALDAQRGKMLRVIEDEPEQNLHQVEVAEWASSLAHHFAIDCPVLKADEVWMEPAQSVEIDVSWDRGRYFSDARAARHFPGERITIHVPFDGDVGVFRLAPSSFTTILPHGRVKDSDILLTVEYARDQAPPVQNRLNEFVSLVSKYLDWARSDIEAFNATLEQQAVSAIEARLARVGTRNAELASTGIPIGRPGTGGQKTYIADVLVRRPAPSLPQTWADEKTPRLEPVIAERVFAHILEIIRKACLHIERHPETYLQMGEEERRNVILSTLETHYDGFTAETHNQAGHTDIIARHDGRNVFICECKFWSGQKGFTETVDQLFGYAGWRDTKLAIVMFVREQNLTDVLAKARTALEMHPQFVGRKPAAGETELRATMHWQGDEQRLGDLNVFFVHTPAA